MSAPNGDLVTTFVPEKRTCCDTFKHQHHHARCGIEEYEQAKAATYFNDDTGLIHCGHCGGEHPGGHPLLPVWPTSHQYETWRGEASRRFYDLEEELQRALWQVGALMDHCRLLLDGKRPQWWRAAVRWQNNHEWSKP